MERRNIIFRGRVQGVFFRATTAEIASGLAVTGFVRNLPDGSVELEAQGEPAELDCLVSALEDRYVGFIRDRSVSARPVTASDAPFHIAR